MNCIGYTRVSTPTAAKEGESLKTQREAIEHYAQEKGWTLLNIYSDEGVSGAKSNRPAFTKLLEEVQKKQTQFVIIHRLSRFGRNARDLLNNVERLKENGAKLVSLKDGIDYTTPYGEAMLTVFAAMAQLERDIIDEQMKENKLAKWRDGRTIVGRLPFGYCVNKEDKKNQKIEVVPKEKKLYHRIVGLYLDQGKSFSDIALQLKDEGVKCRSKNWSSASLSYVLKNPIYWGHYVVNKIKYNGKKRTKEEKPPSEHIPVTIDPPFFITKTRWDEIQKRTQFNKSKGKHITISENYFLRDVLVCKNCGGRIKPKHGNKRKKDGSRPRYYGCYWSSTSDKDLKASGRKKCSLPYLKADEVEKEVWDYLIWVLGLRKIGKDKHLSLTPFDKLFDGKKYEQKLKQLEDQFNDLGNEIEGENRAKERLYHILKDKKDRSKEFLEKHEEAEERLITLKSKREDVKKEIDNLREMKDNDSVYKEFLRDSKGFIKRLISDLQKLSPKDKKVLIEGMLKEKIGIRKGREEGKGWETEMPKLRFNREILTQFMDEGKIAYLNKATPNHPSRYEL